MTLTFHSKPPTARPPAAAVPARPMNEPLPTSLDIRDAPIWNTGHRGKNKKVTLRNFCINPSISPRKSLSPGSHLLVVRQVGAKGEEGFSRGEGKHFYILKHVPAPFHCPTAVQSLISEWGLTLPFGFSQAHLLQEHSRGRSLVAPDSSVSLKCGVFLHSLVRQPERCHVWPCWPLLYLSIILCLADSLVWVLLWTRVVLVHTAMGTAVLSELSRGRGFLNCSMDMLGAHSSLVFGVQGGFKAVELCSRLGNAQVFFSCRLWAA